MHEPAHHRQPARPDAGIRQGAEDGQANLFGGLWIGTLAQAAGAGKSTIYRYLEGELRMMRGNMSIPNAICFPPDGRLASCADTGTRTAWPQRQDPGAHRRPYAEARIVTDERSRFWTPGGDRHEPQVGA
ncbi:SMP-30/gluconolactonase/LRE family protein [Paracoccus sp. PXZ]|nr:SMP-30/gluconolactonase/LRE family protein [Paracoccus sp. MKU1]KRW95552.1 hypothetical protein AQY21_14100 [Paracoccus sp. MKU1]